MANRFLTAREVAELRLQTVADLLRQLGALSADEVRARCVDEATATLGLAALLDARRAARSGKKVCLATMALSIQRSNTNDPAKADEYTLLTKVFLRNIHKDLPD